MKIVKWWTQNESNKNIKKIPALALALFIFLKKKKENKTKQTKTKARTYSCFAK